MFIPTEIILVVSLALTLLLVVRAWSTAVPECGGVGRVERLRFPAIMNLNPPPFDQV
jgi:hypothetical protein